MGARRRLSHVHGGWGQDHRTLQNAVTRLHVRKGIAHSCRPWEAATSTRIQASCSEGSKWFFDALMPDVCERVGERTRIKKGIEHPLSRMRQYYSACGPCVTLTLTSLDYVSILIFHLRKYRTLFPTQWSTAEPKALKHDCCSNSHVGGMGASALESLPTSDLPVVRLSHLLTVKRSPQLKSMGGVIHTM